ncbi:sugar phosphate isomerase/epimerase [uncultured Tateyamaria sp.]|uniref:sugar phosphate isomerase/epimerase family protein n=1 Tax=uncultured Tateyamaria sp. TaxID=455651 RepID=UPI0026226816|nr:sugar phosphate isomerase/epimerase [uncultured Tateyamaria sp.]
MTAFSYQLYSSRNFEPLGETLSMLAGLGYAQVEGYGALLADPAAIDALEAGLRATGLAMPTSHVGLDMIEADPAAVGAIAGRLGMKTAIVPFIMPDARPTDAAGWAAYGAGLEKAAAALKGHGLGLGYHNHDFEYAALADGSLPIDHILGNAPSVAYEFDVAWAVRAGVDPMDSIRSYGPRILSAHLKDIAPAGENTDEDGWADVGHGTMDWPTLFGALKDAGTTYFVMEHDNPSSHLRFASRALAAAQSF